MKAQFVAAAAALFAAGALAKFADATVSVSKRTECRCFPGDACWPSSCDWDKLNQTVSGRLIATVPLAHPCHDPDYDPERCLALQNGWQDPATQ
jgi:hypothetical protein